MNYRNDNDNANDPRAIDTYAHLNIVDGKVVPHEKRDLSSADKKWHEEQKRKNNNEN